MVHVFDNAVTPEQRAEIGAWVRELHAQRLLVPNGLGPHRFHRNIAELPWVHPALLDLRAALVERFGLGRYRTDPAYGDMVSFHESGAFVHAHTDPFVEGVATAASNPFAWINANSASKRWLNPSTNSRGISGVS